MVRKNILSIFVALIIMYLSLANTQTFDKVHFFNFRYFDKIVHFLMYSGFMSVIIFENRKFLSTIRQLFLVAIIPFLYGIFIEILQSTVTASRSGSFYDALANLAGIIVAILLWLCIKPLINSKIKL